MKHEYFAIGSAKDFIVFNSIDDLSDDNITNNDLVIGEFKDISKLRSIAWSSGCDFFFIIANKGIYLCNSFNNKFLLCRKKSYKFIEYYLTTGSKSVSL